MKAIVIGAGIGGLACAVALRRVGWEVVVYERASELREVGAGISLWANALRALDHLGAGDAVRAASRAVTQGEFKRADGKVILHYDTAAHERRSRLPTTIFMVHRAELIAALASRIGGGVIRCGRELVAARREGDTAVARFADGREDSADLLIGADGINSVVRQAVRPDDPPPRYGGYVAWRGVAPAGPELVAPGYVAEVWGLGARFGISSLPDGVSGPRIYWWASVNRPRGSGEADAKAFLQKTFDDRVWARPVPQLIEMTPGGSILRGEVVDRVPALPWSNGPMVLIGDAAHPTTPNLGQGGCMAIEDAPVLARCLRLAPTVRAALERFERERFGRTAGIMRTSRRLGWIGQRSNPAVCAVRDFCFGLAPERAAFAMMLKWTLHDTGGV